MARMMAASSGCVGHALHEALVDLEPGDREALEHAQRGVAGAVVVEGDLHPVGAQLAQRADHAVVGAQQDVLRHLQLQRRGRQPDRARAWRTLLTRSPERSCEPNRLTPMRNSLAPSSRHAAAWRQAVRRTHCPTSTEIGRFSSPVMKAAGDSRPSRGWRQRSSASAPTSAFVREPHLRLVEHLELFVVAGAAQLVVVGAGAVNRPAQGGREGAVAVATVVLRLVERQVGAGQQLGRGAAVARVCGDADAGTDAHRVAVECDGPRQRADDGFGDLAGLAVIGDVAQQHGELVAAEAGHGVGGAHAAEQALCDLPEHGSHPGHGHGRR